MRPGRRGDCFVLALSALALAGLSAAAGCSAGSPEKTPATIASARPTATQQAQPAERPSGPATPVSAATEPPGPTPAAPVDAGQPISGVPTSAPVDPPTAVPATSVPVLPTVPPAPTVPPPVVQPTKAPPPATGVVYPCEAGDCNCSDFPSHAEAQRVYNKHGGNNWSGLDRDRDGIACESLP